MKTACVTLEDVLVAASIRAASLVPETSGYLTLALVDATNRMPLGVEDRAVLLTTDGTVTLARRGPVLPNDAAASAVRDVLARLLAVSIGSMPGLSATARPRVEGDRGVDAVASELEAALIPVNRQAARRALARLARETSRAREMGKISAAQRAASGSVDAPAPKRAAATTLVGHAPQPAAEPPRPMLTARIEVEVEASAPPPALDLARVSADGFADALGVSETPSIVCTFETPEPEAYVVEGPPSEPTPTAMGMHTREGDEAPASCTPASVSAPSPEPRKRVLETAPWRALDDAAIAALGLGEGEATEIDAVAAVAPVEAADEAVETSAPPADVAPAAAEPSAITPAASEAIVAPSEVPAAACEPVVAPCDAVLEPIVACAAPAEAADEAPQSDGPTLELYVEDLALPALALALEAEGAMSRATLPFPLTFAARDGGARCDRPARAGRCRRSPSRRPRRPRPSRRRRSRRIRRPPTRRRPRSSTRRARRPSTSRPSRSRSWPTCP